MRIDGAVPNADELIARALERGVAKVQVPTRALGAAAGVSPMTASRWLRGVRVAPESEQRLRAALGLDTRA